MVQFIPTNKTMTSERTAIFLKTTYIGTMTCHQTSWISIHIHSLEGFKLTIFFQPISLKQMDKSKGKIKYYNNNFDIQSITIKMIGLTFCP
jgi:hypothetical protein